MTLRRGVDQAGDHRHLPVGELDTQPIARMRLPGRALALQARVYPTGPALKIHTVDCTGTVPQNPPLQHGPH